MVFSTPSSSQRNVTTAHNQLINVSLSVGLLGLIHALSIALLCPPQPF
ncbi:hypothetical protein ACSSV5_001140 [Psychroflexus sp. MBR-150]|jgi:hypothetical protein